MDHNNRPERREKYVTNDSKGVHKRGEGLGTGKVGSGSNPAGGSNQGRGAGTGTPVTRSGGKGGLIAIIILAVVLLGGGGGGLSGLFGNILGGGDTTDYGISTETYNTIVQSSTDTQTSTSTSAGRVDETVATGSRAKYTTIKGAGQDTVTIMVYMCGTDLESKNGMATNDLVEMTKATLSDKVHVVVYTGGCNQWRNQVISSSKNQIYEIKSGGLQLLESDMGTGAMTKPATLTQFIQWAAAKYPANRNELIFWDHGGGSISGYGYDEKNTSAGSMGLAGINQALKDTGVKFDMIGFDTCLMATVENGLMLNSYADYMVASEETEPGIGWYYTDWLTKFSANTSMATVDVGKQIVDDFVTTCGRQCQGQSATLSVVDLAELSNTAPASLKNFSESISEMIQAKEYSAISTARNGTREFAQSNAIDQIDLVHFARNLGTDEATELANVLQSAVKYNRTSANMTNSYGLSIYFPYRKARNVDAAVNAYNAIGMDESYSQCIREFASLEVSGQVATGGTSSPFPSLFGSLLGGGTTTSSASAGSADMIGSLLGSFLGGDFGSIAGLDSGNTGFLSGRSLSMDDTVSYISENYLDTANLAWTQNSDGQTVISMPEDQWALIQSLDVNMFYDDGAGYVDLGLDNTFDFDDEGNLIGECDGTWLAVNGQPVAYYHERTSGGVTTGYIPAFLNGERVELLVTFDETNPRGAIVGARRVYTDGETETVAKSTEALAEGDQIDFLCDYYTYDGEYQDTYYLGETMTVDGDLVLSNVPVGDGGIRLTYRFTDLYQQHYWTAPLEY